MNSAIFKKNIKGNWKFLVIMTAIMTFYFIIMLFALNVMKNESNIGMSDEITEFTGEIILGAFFRSLVPLMSMIYIIIVANKLVAAQVDRGSLAYIMANPIKRNQFTLTQAIFLILSIVFMFLAQTIVGLIMIAAFSISITIGTFLLSVLGGMLLILALSAISFFASCLFNLSRRSLLLGAGCPILFYLFNMLAEYESLAEFLGNFKYFTILSLFNIGDIFSHSLSLIWQFLILAGVAALGYGGGILCFKRKDLPL